MKKQQSVEKRVRKSVARYRAGLERLGMAGERLEEIVKRYEEQTRQMYAFDSEVKDVLNGLGLPVSERIGCMNLARRLYGRSRKYGGGTLMHVMGRAAAAAILDGLPKENVLEVLRTSWKLVAGDSPNSYLDMLEGFALKYAGPAGA